MQAFMQSMTQSMASRPKWSMYFGAGLRPWDKVAGRHIDTCATWLREALCGGVRAVELHGRRWCDVLQPRVRQKSDWESHKRECRAASQLMGGDRQGSLWQRRERRRTKSISGRGGGAGAAAAGCTC